MQVDKVRQFKAGEFMNKNDIKNFAVFVAGIDEEYQGNIIDGINAFTKENNINTSYFAAFGGVLASKRYDIGEYSIYNLANLDKFDGVILMTNTINAPDVRNEIIKKVQAAKIPAVVFDCDSYPEFYNINIDNFTPIQDIVRHLIKRHNAQIINYISGPLENPEALTRYNAFKSVMKEYGLPVEEERVFFGEFRAQDGRQAIDDLIESGINMPDAIVCANDAMAIAAVNALEKYGYTVPDDVIVTGFDCTYNARNFTPTMTTVDRPLSDAGYLACHIILDTINGISHEKNTTLDAYPVFSESCGCIPETAEDFASFKKNTFNLIESCNSHISMINKLTAGLAETETPEENFNVIKSFFEEIECEKCSICLCSGWEGSFSNSYSEIPADNINSNYFTNRMSAPVIWENGNCRSVQSFPCENMFPEPPETGGNINYFLPIHFRENCFGYYIIQNSSFPVKSRLCHSFIMNIGNSVENIRKLIHLNNAIKELNNLYVIDPLCNIYNRNGFIKIADDMYKDCIANKYKVMIAFIDMDGLKFINDNYGHNEGDFAIQRLSGAIRECCETNSICARFGGDEFVIFGANMDEQGAAALSERIERKINEVNNIFKKPYLISASLGYFVTEAQPATTLYSIIHTADERMYEIKKKKKNSRSYNS